MAHPAALLFLLPIPTAFILFQTGVAPAEYQWLASLGVGGSLAALILIFYRADRKASEDRYAALAMEFRKIVTENTTATIQNTDAVIGLRAHISDRRLGN